MSANVEQAAKELLRLQAELEALEARIKEQNAILIDAVEVGGTVVSLLARELAKKLADREAAIQRVRDACVSSHVDDKGKKVVFLDRIQRALGGAE